MKYIPAIFYAALLFFLSSLPSTKIPTFGVEFEDLYMHFMAYFVFGACLGLAFAKPAEQAWIKKFIGIAVIGIIYGATDEFHQSFVPGRTPALSDLYADSLGVLCGSWFYLKYGALFLKKKGWFHL